MYLENERIWLFCFHFRNILMNQYFFYRATVTYGRFAENFSWFLSELGVPKIAFPIAKLTLRRRIMKSMWGHGIGRHSPENIRKIGEEDLKAFSQFLANKPYFMGDEPSLIDATMFGFLAELVWFMPPDHWTTKVVKEDYQNLASYCERMRTKFWPDWNDNLKNANKPTKF